MKRLHGERNIEWLGRLNVRIEQIEEEIRRLPPEGDDEILPGQEFPDVSADPRSALEEELSRLQTYRMQAVEAAQRDGDK